MGNYYTPTRRNPYAGENINLRDVPTLGRLLIDLNIISKLGRSTNIPFISTRRDECDRVNAGFDRLEEIARTAGPKFVLAHALVPHPPYFIDRTGRCLGLAEVQSRTRRDNYLEQLAYANNRLNRLLDILDANARPAIIIIQSDEGPFPEAYVNDERFVGGDTLTINWAGAEPDALREKMEILLAIRLPNGDRYEFPAHATPVNVYRNILSRYFGADLPPLEERNFVFASEAEPWRFVDVTDILRAPRGSEPSAPRDAGIR